MYKEFPYSMTLLFYLASSQEKKTTRQLEEEFTLLHPIDVRTSLSTFHRLGLVERVGEGVSGDPYSYTCTDKGKWFVVDIVARGFEDFYTIFDALDKSSRTE